MTKIFQAPWGIRDLIYYFLATATILGLGVLLIKYFGTNLEIKNSGYKSSYFLVLYLLQCILLIAPIVVISIRRKCLSLKSFGIENIGIWKTIIEALKAYGKYIGITILVVIFMVATNIKIPGYEMQENILPLFGKTIPSMIIAGIMIVIIAPIIEEIVFRGFILRTLVNRIGIFLGSLLTAGIFAILHMQFKSIIPIFILGLIINSIVTKNKSIIPAILFHVINNAIAFIMEMLILFEIVKI